MNYFGVSNSSLVNGEGIRTVLWVSGCNHHCDGCQNPESWDPGYGMPWTTDDLAKLIKQVNKTYIDGLTLSGGDPMHPLNRFNVCGIAKTVKTSTLKSIWMYTGYAFEDIKDEPILDYLDVIVDGKYDCTRQPALWRGSDNQRIWRKKDDIWSVDYD